MTDKVVDGRYQVVMLRKARRSQKPHSVLMGELYAGAVDNLMFMRRENAQSDAVFYLTGKDIENECEYAMTFDKVMACWQLQGDAEELSVN